MKNFLIPIDFSNNSLNAARYGAAIASVTNNKLILFHSFELPVEIQNTYGYISDEEYFKVETWNCLKM